MDFPIKIVKDKISREELKRLTEKGYGDTVKAAVDVEKGIMAVGGEWHSEAQALLVEDGSSGLNVWGVNIFLDRTGDEMVEYVALINIKPSLNRSMEIQDEAVKNKIKAIIINLIG